MELKYEDSRGRTVTVVNINGNIAELNNGERVALERLQDGNFYKQIGNSTNPVMESNTTTINENNNNNYMNESIPKTRYEKLANGGSVGIGDDGGNITLDRPVNSQTSVGTSVQMGGVVESHNDNLRGLGKEVTSEPSRNPYDNYVPSDNNNTATTENDLLAKYGHTPPPPQKSAGLEDLVNPPKPPTPKEEREIRRSQRVEDVIDPKVIEENPVHQLFDKAKKVHSLEVSLKLNEKIPSKEVIKMMEENFDDVSAIEYYAKDIFKKLMDDPSIIENQVKEAIQKYMRSRTKTKSTKKK